MHGHVLSSLGTSKGLSVKQIPANKVMVACGSSPARARLISRREGELHRLRQVAVAAANGGRNASKYCIKESQPNNGDEAAAKKADTNITIFSAGAFENT